MAASPGVVLSEAQANATVHHNKSNTKPGVALAEAESNAVNNSQAVLG